MISNVGTYLVAHERITFLDDLPQVRVTVKDVLIVHYLTYYFANVTANSTL